MYLDMFMFTIRKEISCFLPITSGKHGKNWRSMRNLRLDICYDGTRYRGWQRLAGEDNTIQGKIEQTLSRILGEPVEISGSGRTDAGAHALGQVANYQLGYSYIQLRNKVAAMDAFKEASERSSATFSAISFSMA